MGLFVVVVVKGNALLSCHPPPPPPSLQRNSCIFIVSRISVARIMLRKYFPEVSSNHISLNSGSTVHNGESINLSNATAEVELHSLTLHASLPLIDHVLCIRPTCSACLIDRPQCSVSVLVGNHIGPNSQRRFILKSVDYFQSMDWNKHEIDVIHCLH